MLSLEFTVTDFIELAESLSIVELKGDDTVAEDIERTGIDVANKIVASITAIILTVLSIFFPFKNIFFIYEKLNLLNIPIIPRTLNKIKYFFIIF